MIELKKEAAPVRKPVPATGYAFKAALALMRNKAVAAAALLATMLVYKNLPSDQPLPFAELLYFAVVVLSVAVAAPLVRLLVFPEAAFYAETGRLVADLRHGEITPMTRHYWFATVLSYLVAFISILSVLA